MNAGSKIINRIRSIILPFSIIMLAYIIFTFLPVQAYHPDEGVWLAAGKHYFQTYFLERDWQKETWQDGRFGPFGTRNPTIGKYLIGGMLFLSGTVDETTLFPGYEFASGFHWDAVKDRQPPQAALAAVRRMMKWLAVIACLAFFLLIKQLTHSWLTAWIATLIFMLSPLVPAGSSRAMMEMPMLTFSLSALLCAERLNAGLNEGAMGKTAVFTLLLGLFCGLAVSTKLNTLPIVATVFLWQGSNLFNYLLRQRNSSALNMPTIYQRITISLLSNLIVLLIMALIFYGSNPFLYDAPIRGTQHMLQLGKIVAGYDVPPGVQIHTWSDKWQAVIQIGLEDSGVFFYWLQLHWPDKMLAASGLLVLLTAWLRKPAAPKQTSFWLLAWFGITLLGVLIWTPFRWGRWYLPLVPCWAVLEGIGMSVLLRWAFHIILAKRYHHLKRYGYAPQPRT